MASSKHNRDNNEFDRPTFSTMTPHFFTVILHKTLEDKRLIMPKKFVLKHGKDLSNEVFVKLPCGSEWEIELRKSNGLVWFQKGWPEFAHHYSIGFGHFIIFKYKGDSQFDAITFDKSTVEIDYPIVPFLCEDHRKRKSSESHIFRSRKKFRAGPVDETRFRPKRNHDQHNVENFPKHIFINNGDSHHVKTKTKGKAGKSITAKHTKFDAFRKANNFESNEKFTYNVVMKVSHVSRPYVMNLPSYYARKFLARNKSYKAVLKLANGRTWPICIGFSSTQARFSWKKFSRDNDLKIGDMCVFELINMKTMLIKVSIFQGEFRPENSVHFPKILGDSQALEAAFRFSSANPFFILTVKPASSFQRVPASFCRAYFAKVNKALMLKLGTKSWSVSVSFYPPNSFTLYGGWMRFVRENSLCLGDVCVFELINTNDFVFEVTIFRVNG